LNANLARRLYETVVGISLFVLSIIFYRFPETYLIADLLALVVTVICGREMVIGAVKGVIGGKLNVAELVTLAIIASLVIGEYLVAAEVALIMTVGGYLEERVIDRSKKSIDNLVSLIPVEATIKRDGSEVRVPLQNIAIDDTVLVRPGEEIPVDGQIINGRARVSEAAITGESLPQDKSEGDMVYAGSFSLDGYLAVKVENRGENSVLGKMVDLTRKALADRPPTVRLADRFATWFTPLVLTLAVTVYILSGDLIRSIAVLVVMCPCTLVLSIPTAQAASLGKLVRNGVLPKGGVYLETGAEVDTLILDKTGTLTIGRPALVGIYPLNGMTEEELLIKAAIAEKYSSHPLARQIIELAEKRDLVIPEPEHSTALPGEGVVAGYGGAEITLSRSSFFTDRNYKHLEAALALSTEQERKGRTTFLAAEGDQIIGLFALEDSLREETVPGISSLKQFVPRLVMLTGDNFDSALKMAAETGIKEFNARQLPAGKVAVLKGYQAQGQKVAAVGDGINDAPLLAAADIGIAMGDVASPLSIDAGDVVLLNGDFNKLPLFFETARRTRSIVKQNIIIFAVIYNLAAFFLAAFGYLSPMGGAIVHNVGSTMVILNSMRLLR